jgi:hypothetical protein
MRIGLRAFYARETNLSVACLDLNSAANGTHIKGWPGHDSTNTHQLWRLITADTKGRVFL